MVKRLMYRELLVRKGSFLVNNRRVYYQLKRSKSGKPVLYLYMKTGSRRFMFVDVVQPGITSVAMRQYARQYLRGIST